MNAERETKSVSVEDTYPHDLMDRPAIRSALTELAERVMRRLKESGHTGRTVTVKARGHDFTTVTRSETLAAAHRRSQAPDSCRTAPGGRARRRRRPGSMHGIRLLGVGISGLAEYAQGDLIAELEGAEEAAAEAAAGAEAAAAEAAGGAGEPSAAEAAGPRRRRGGRRGPRCRRSPSSGRCPSSTEARRWLAGQDVRHAERGPGWVQGAGLGRVTIRFEGPDTPPGRIGTFAVGDPALEPVDAAAIAREALPPAGTPQADEPHGTEPDTTEPHGDGEEPGAA